MTPDKADVAAELRQSRNLLTTFHRGNRARQTLEYHTTTSSVNNLSLDTPNAAKSSAELKNVLPSPSSEQHHIMKAQAPAVYAL